MKKINFVTSNNDKLKEVRDILCTSALTVNSFGLDIPEIQGNPIDVAKAKCVYAQQQIGDHPVVVEDTSLVFNALGDLPGVYIKWFTGSLGLHGLNHILNNYADKSAYAQCVVAYSDGLNCEPTLFVGRCNGTIVYPRGGKGSFGWDPIFEPENCSETFAEMPLETKNAMSHRTKAFVKLRDYLQNNQ